ncbi:MAG: RluA family pseudouridine synthase [Parasporobacterium sp.]|nr:RluA family pseudouridine synthase [Parasporobacterium sp.]
MGLIVYNVQDEYEGLRVDRFLSEQSDDLSRSYIQKLIREQRLIVGEKPVKASYQVRSGDLISFEVPPNLEPQILPENIPLEILFEDPDLIVVNKPKGMVVHPAAGHDSGTLVNALLYHCRDLSGINGILRPGIVHRIDKDTSGILVCAKSDQAHRGLAEQFKVHSIHRMYEAVCVGNFKESAGTVTGSIGRNPNQRKLMAINERNGKPAVTHYQVIRNFSKYSHISCILETGRTHQIRVHMASIHHPLLGDISYGGNTSSFKLDGKDLEGQTLHARELGFIHPITGAYLEFTSELPEYFQKLLKKLENRN